MSFTLANWTCVSPSLNQGQETIVPFGGSSTVENAPNIFMYGSPNDTVATISASNYFLAQYASLCVGDWILGNGTDASFSLVVTAVSSTSVTTASTGLTTSIGTANIVNNAVTYAKIQQASAANVLLGNPTGGAANYSEVTLGNGLDFASTALELKPSYLNVVEVSLTAAQFNGMYATPVQVIAAPGANKINVVDKVVMNMTFVSAQYASGGVVGLQYGNTAHLAGPAASATEAASDYTGAAASTVFRFGGGLSTGAPISTCANTAIYISNATGAFTTGDSTFKCWVYYVTLPTNS
jgi:hypothetical protein